MPISEVRRVTKNDNTPYKPVAESNKASTPKAVVVADALWCGTCKPEAQPVPMPEIY